MINRSGVNKFALYVLSAGTLSGLALIGVETARGKKIGVDFEKSKDDFSLFKRVPPPSSSK